MDQGSTRKCSAVHNFAPTVTKFCVMWEGQALPHDTKFGNCRYEIVGTIVIFIWSLIHGLYWSGLIKAEPGWQQGKHQSLTLLVICMGDLLRLTHLPLVPHNEGILPKGPYPPCVSMAGRALLAEYHQYMLPHICVNESGQACWKCYWRNFYGVNVV